ncbi:rho family, other [Cryptococcus neoformans C23]|uniref:Rho family, other n=2 Tax=Cryptococcus neoformans TaxID=5207 RepID=A0A854QBH5_CRYNE|nr:rho family protein [Cryptococcus neoformans var. grubii H99]AUB25751.1 rho family protein [Cryptococcus neoformans var. grubii]OWZ30906.1 rho family, other [Cryptococcus neoformans var. grubii AD2-60a]OWZ40069.1 rho family, other [Cryptococcus neoformans var. grubii AD1-83a]OWZ42961.1 rho family, other [Cryptococcus neoformans var. grubii C23]OWZ53616.1 rho family, other [Cryptococcus neoformans var. grubii 125.91]OXC83980.1 rho family, other [Cryptococcus neoformans var. grubii AD1-7a]OX|eukprot:XP_012050729.1 rho family protein [Cryptococcus neoformans var. grubii H99]
MSSSPNNRAIRRKLVIVGDGAAGKTSLLNVFAVGHFSESYEPTVFDNYVTEIELDGKPVQLALWDTAGQEEYERLRPLSYSKAHVILIAFAVDTPDSLENVTQKWIEEVRSICGKAIPVILVACKTDLRDKAVANGTYSPERFTDHATGQRIADSIGAKGYFETSALQNRNVDAVFEAATRAAVLVRDAGHGGVGATNGSFEGGGRKDWGREKEEKKFGCCVIA